MLGAPVERITIGEGGVRVAGGGVELDGSGAIVAVPASVLSEIELDPPLEDSRAGAFAAVRYGEAAKLFAPLESAVEPRAVMSMPERYSDGFTLCNRLIGYSGSRSNATDYMDTHARWKD